MNTDSTTVLEMRNVSKMFGSHFALDDVDYSVHRGTVFALLGENGAGKTTTIRILLGLCKPDVGTSRVLGMDSLRDHLTIRRSVGYVPEQPVLYDWLTVAEIGRFTAAFYSPVYIKRYTELIAAYGIRENVRIKALSKGMRAKVSLALALSHDPELLILDEPTSGLDALVRREFLESMVDRAATGKTVFLSSHQIGEVERVADVVAIMKKSKLLVVEPLEELKATSHVLNITLKEEEPQLPSQLKNLVGSIIEHRQQGRQWRFTVRSLLPGIRERLAENPHITQIEIKTPTLEDIFVAYMSGDD